MTRMVAQMYKNTKENKETNHRGAAEGDGVPIWAAERKTYTYTSGPELIRTKKFNKNRKQNTN